MIAIELNDEQFAKLSTPEFQKWAIAKDLELVGPMDGSKEGKYIYRVGRPFFGNDIVSNLEAAVDLMAFVNLPFSAVV